MISRIEDLLVSNLSFLGVKDLNLLGRLQNSMADRRLDLRPCSGCRLAHHKPDPYSLYRLFLMKDGREFQKRS
jgi:hypothetical protein